MRIAYLNLMLGVPTGPSKKLMGQAAALDRLGVEGFDILVLNTQQSRRLGRVHLVPLPRGPATSVERGLARFRLFGRLVACGEYDLLLVRYPGADPWGPAFVRRYPTVTEHHTKEAPEKEALLAGVLPPSQRLHKHMVLAAERTLGPRIINGTRAIVGVSGDVRDYEVERGRFGGPTLALTNGVLVDEVRQTGFVPFDGRELHLAVVGSEASPWVGVDRLLEGLAGHTGATRIVCHFVGAWQALEVPARLPPTVSLVRHGTLFGDALDQLLRTVTLGISSLALHRNQMTEGSPLKTREYVARGLPVVTGYPDPDLEHPSTESFHLELPADDSPVSPERIIAFAESLLRGVSVSDEMRAYAHRHMDWGPRMDRLVRFLRGL